ncbi:MAG: hypothetical protein IKP33_06655, partial [Prevotella sp.]|nr:hypothetical protein [Prevotella sp.]
MKKFFTLMMMVMAVSSAFATVTTVWEGNEPISWNPDEVPGSQYEVPASCFTGLKEGDVIQFYTTTTYESPQYCVTYKAGNDWVWTDLTTTFSNNVITYTVESSQIATEIAERGVVVRGQAYNLVKVTIESEDTPQPVGEQTVWEGNEPISWNPDEVPGSQYEVSASCFTGLKAGDVMKFYTTTTYESPQYCVTYKAGNDWVWTDLATTFSDNVMTYTVESSQIATEIAERGVVMRGQAYNLVKITVTKAS